MPRTVQSRCVLGMGVPFNGMDPEAARRAEIRAMNTARQQQDARGAHQVAQDRREHPHTSSSHLCGCGVSCPILCRLMKPKV